MASAREQLSPKFLLDAVRKAVPSATGLVITTVPRGDLQVVQPVNVPDGLLKAYARGFHAEDELTWRAIVRQQPVRETDAWSAEELQQSAYFHEWLRPQGLAHVVAVPVASPLLVGYPGVVHVCRTADQGPFSKADIERLKAAIEEYERKADKRRGGSTSGKGAAQAA